MAHMHLICMARRMSADELEDVVDTLFDAMHELYVKAGAINYLVMDVPPVGRSPGGKLFIQCRYKAANDADGTPRKHSR